MPEFELERTVQHTYRVEIQSEEEFLAVLAQIRNGEIAPVSTVEIAIEQFCSPRVLEEK